MDCFTGLRNYIINFSIKNSSKELNLPGIVMENTLHIVAFCPLWKFAQGACFWATFNTNYEELNAENKGQSKQPDRENCSSKLK